jgi:CubicO group peptidase (beta-lactamase class C family)
MRPLPFAKRSVSRRRFLRATTTTALTTATWSALRTATDVLALHHPAAEPRALLAESHFAALDEAIEAAMAEGHVPGVAVALLRDDEEYVHGYGVTSVDHPLPVDGDTLFQIGSNTKTYTATAIMRLVDQGRLDLDTPIRHYVPDLRLSNPDATERVTLRHLLTHTSGLAADYFVPFGGGDDALARYAAGLGDVPFVLPLGAYPSYSNVGFSLAGRVLEAAVGRPYEAAIEALLLTPLAMDNSTFFAADAIRYATAVGHTALDDGAYVQRPWDLPRTSNPAGGLVQSVRDLLRWGRFWLGNGTAPSGERLLSPEAMALMTTPQVVRPGDLGHFGLAWSVAEVAGGTHIVHDGATAGQQSIIAIAPAESRVFCLLTNSTGGASILAGLESDPAPAAAIARTAAELAAYAGRYENPGYMRQTLAVHDGALEMTPELTDPFLRLIEPQLVLPTVSLAFSAPERFYAVDSPGEQGAFLTNPDGSVAGLFWENRYFPRVS